MLEITQTLSKRDVKLTRDALSDFLGIPEHDLHIVGSGYNYDNAQNINLLLDARKYSLKKVKSLMNLYKSNNRVHGPWQPDYFYFPVGGAGLDYSGSTGDAAIVDIGETYNPDWSFFINRQGSGSQYKGLGRYTFIKHSIPHVLSDPKYDQVVTSAGQPVAIAGRKLTQHAGIRRIFAMRPRSSDGTFVSKWNEVEYGTLRQYYPEFKVTSEQYTIKHPEHFANQYAHTSTDQLSTTESITECLRYDLTTRQMTDIMKAIEGHRRINS